MNRFLSDGSTYASSAKHLSQGGKLLVETFSVFYFFDFHSACRETGR